MEVAELPEGFVVAGRYRIERLLGRGAMGAVYSVRHAFTDERFALKVLHAGLAGDAPTVARFRREARAPAQIDSEHIVRVTDADTAPELGGAPFIVMDFLRGEDLEQAVARGPMAPLEVVRHLRQAALALDKAHAAGVVHRDLKPANLFVATRPDGSTSVKILDFGLAKVAEGVPGLLAGPATADGAMLGTPLYMSPEQARGKNDRIGPWTDVWAVGIVAHKLLTGRDYWVFDTLAQLVLRIAHEPMPPPSMNSREVDAAFDAWFARCCARQPALRFGTVGEAVEALAVALGVPSAQPDTERQAQVPASDDADTVPRRPPREELALPTIVSDDEALAFEPTELVAAPAPPETTLAAGPRGSIPVIGGESGEILPTVVAPYGPAGTEPTHARVPPIAIEVKRASVGPPSAARVAVPVAPHVSSRVPTALILAVIVVFAIGAGFGSWLLSRATASPAPPVPAAPR